ncbi:hypothetical protein YC2023_081025 [Brassica napus]
MGTECKMLTALFDFLCLCVCLFEPTEFVLIPLHRNPRILRYMLTNCNSGD